MLGLAAQQTIGNLFAGTVLLSARPFRVGDRVRLQGGPLAGTVEGVVSSLGLLYTTLANGDDPIMVPNSVVPELGGRPAARARRRRPARAPAPGATPRDVQARSRMRSPCRCGGPPASSLEELDGDEVIVRVQAMPLHPTDGPRARRRGARGGRAAHEQPASGGVAAAQRLAC